MNTYKPPRGAWKHLPPGETPEQFRDLDDENGYYDHLALEEYRTNTRRQFVLALSRRNPPEIRAISLEKLLWELPGLGGSTTMGDKGQREVSDSLGVVARTVLVECAGYIVTGHNAATIEKLLTSRNVDPLCLFLARLLRAPNTAVRETSCSVLLNLVRAPGRTALCDMTSMDMGEMTKLLLLRLYQVFQNNEEQKEQKEQKEGWDMEQHGDDKQSSGSGMAHVAHTQGFHMLCILDELLLVPNALPWIRHGVVQLVPTILVTLVPEGAHGSLHSHAQQKHNRSSTSSHDNQEHSVSNLVYSSSCRDLDSFETLCRILTSLSKDNASATLMRDAGFVETWLWMLRERRIAGDGKDYADAVTAVLGGNLDDDEHQRRVVRSFFDVLWEWTFSDVMAPKVRDILMTALARTVEHEEEKEGTEEVEGKEEKRWVEDEVDVVVRRLHPSSDLAMQACGILWNCMDQEEDIVELEEDLLSRGVVDRLSLILLKSHDCGALTCCAGALYNLVQTDSLTFHVSSQEGLVEHLKWLKDAENARELVHDQQDRLKGDPALRYRGVEERPTAGLAASAVSVHSKTSDVIARLTKACDRVLRRLMGDDEDEDLSAIERRWMK